jgi:formate dehydrogenase maturation protein FdhE
MFGSDEYKRKYTTLLEMDKNLENKLEYETAVAQNYRDIISNLTQYHDMAEYLNLFVCKDKICQIVYTMPTYDELRNKIERGYYFQISISIKTYCLSGEIREPICSLLAEIGYFGNDELTLFIDCLDTVSSERRNGHASRLLKKIIQKSEKLKVTKIYGEIWDRTNIGFENLKEFYKKNGFDISSKTFIMKLR